MFKLKSLSSRLFSTTKALKARKYTPDHEWISIKDNIGTFGITDFAQKALGDVVYIEVPSIGDKFVKKDQIGAVESVKAASDIYAPVSGTVIEINEKLTAEPSLINTSAFVDGWIAKIELDNKAELDVLLDEKAYTALIE